MKTLQKIDNSIWYSFRSSIWDSIYLLSDNSIEDFTFRSIRNSFYWNLELTENLILDSIQNSIKKLNDKF
jgi:hypothetical protein